jgi:hypothetical protein
VDGYSLDGLLDRLVGGGGSEYVYITKNTPV